MMIYQAYIKSETHLYGQELIIPACLSKTFRKPA